MDSQQWDESAEHCEKKEKPRDFYSCENRKVLISKAFYTFFYLAVGSLFPYLPVYFKQLHLSPYQTGVLIGVRPLIQFLMTPIWGACADKLCKSKALLLMSVLGWLFSNFSLSLVPDSSRSKSCDFYTQDLGDGVAFLQKDVGRNDSKTGLHERRLEAGEVLLRYRNVVSRHPKTVASPLHSYLSLESLSKVCSEEKNTSGVGSALKKSQEESEWPLRDVFEEITQNQGNEQANMENDDIIHNQAYLSCESAVFNFLLIVTVVGTMISAPTQMLADTATLQSLDGETHKYGRVRLWGSLGWGIGGFLVGSAVSTNYKTDSCGEVVIDYLPCFYVYATGMAFSFLCATQFEFDYAFGSFSCEERSLTEGLKVFQRPQFCFVMFLAFFCGSATGFIETFLFWYLHELGGGQILFSTINGLNCLAEVGVFLLTDRLLSSLGHINVMYLALFCYSIRFFYFYFVVSPWFVLLAELLQGITTAAFWAACVSYVGLNPGASYTLQGILNGFYMGLGFATGGFAGGALVHYVGMPDAFLVYAFASLLLLIAFAMINAFVKR